MKKIFSLVLALALAVGMLFSTGTGLAASTDLGTDQYMVMFEGPASKGVLQAFGVQQENILHEFQLLPVYVVKLTTKQAKGLANHPQIKFVEKDAEVRATLTIPWGVARVNAPAAHNQGITGMGIKVAVLDTGIDRSHPDLSVNVKGGYSVFTDSANRDPYYDGNGHGTHVAGTIAAAKNNVGIIGVAPDAQLYAVKVLNNSGNGSYSGIAEGIEWSINNRMKIINMSLSGSTHSSILEQFCNLAYNSGILLVAAAGNSGNSSGTGDNVGYPARYASVIAVGATDSNNRPAPFSSTGSAVELCAPGVSILSTIPGNRYASYNGTSMAAPHVTGVAALYWQIYPTYSNFLLRDHLRITALNIGLPPNQCGYGLVQYR